ncbi:DUF4339 domain-containing protein [Tautonia plasticadhaerens]|uniref:GYF domain-containing protein n=1 Tax=Tautonia plasticadhaerens TaxID=2527974 RepID=A0A518GZZ1_9BACT|nr:DUF4339 domain-containing protein [Tautonia plasticadhaerens]QDV34153.1 hypothetical protein ElP_20360 [Tautonia plasticadhaerens]
MATSWFYRDGDNTEVGPYTPRQFAELVRLGEITPVTKVRRDGRRWHPAGKVRGLMEHVAATQIAAAEPAAAADTDPPWESLGGNGAGNEDANDAGPAEASPVPGGSVMDLQISFGAMKVRPWSVRAVWEAGGERKLVRLNRNVPPVARLEQADDATKRAVLHRIAVYAAVASPVRISTRFFGAVVTRLMGEAEDVGPQAEAVAAALERAVARGTVGDEDRACILGQVAIPGPSLHSRPSPAVAVIEGPSAPRRGIVTRNGLPCCANCGRQVSLRRGYCRSCGQAVNDPLTMILIRVAAIFLAIVMGAIKKSLN